MISAKIVKSRFILPLLLSLLFLFRLWFGLGSEFWFEDEMQIYLIGLKYYCTGNYPFFGPDVVYTSSQIPGGLQGLLVGLPLFMLHIPEAPFIFLNLINTAALILLARYLIRITPSIPAWFTYTWILTCPWVMNYGTHVVNPSYILPAAIVFFIAFFESNHIFSQKRLAVRWCFFLMAASLLWIMQLHLSWVLLLPFIALSLIVGIKNSVKKISIHLLFFLAGCLLCGVTLIPTLIQYGPASGGAASNIVFNPHNAKEFITVLSRFLSLASFEAPRFMGINTAERIAFLSQWWWAAPFAIFAGIIGLIQPIWMIIAAFLKNPSPKFKRLVIIVGSAFLITWLSFLFSIKGPSSHTFYLMFPLVMIYSFYCWQPLFCRKWFRILAVLLLVSGMVFHIAVGVRNYETRSMYIKRDIPLKAIQEKDYRIMGERRSWDRND